MNWISGIVIALGILSFGGALVAFAAGLIAWMLGRLPILRRATVTGKDARIGGLLLMAALPVDTLVVHFLLFSPCYNWLITMGSHIVAITLVAIDIGLFALAASLIFLDALGESKQAPAIPPPARPAFIPPEAVLNAFGESNQAAVVPPPAPPAIISPAAVLDAVGESNQAPAVPPPAQPAIIPPAAVTVKKRKAAAPKKNSGKAAAPEKTD